MTRKCAHCGIDYVVCDPQDRYCSECVRRLAMLAQQDARRRVVRFQAKELSPWGPAA